MRHLTVWVIEFFKLVGRRRLHPLVTQRPGVERLEEEVLKTEAVGMDGGRPGGTFAPQGTGRAS